MNHRGFGHALKFVSVIPNNGVNVFLCNVLSMKFYNDIIIQYQNQDFMDLIAL